MPILIWQAHGDRVGAGLCPWVASITHSEATKPATYISVCFSFADIQGKYNEKHGMSTVGLPDASASWNWPSYTTNAAAVTARMQDAEATSPVLADSGSLITSFSPSTPPSIPVSSSGDQRFLNITQWPGVLASTDVTYEALAQLQPNVRQMQVWEQAPSNSALDQIIGRNASATTQQNRFVGLGSALLEQVASTGASYRQTVVNIGAVYSPDKVQGKATSALWAIKSNPSASAELTIKTQSGATVHLSIADQKNPTATGSGIAVQIEVEGNLTPQEQEALKSLAKGFDQAIQGLTGEPPALDIAGLTQYDSKLLSKVELKVDVYGVDDKGARILKLGAQFKADAASREIGLKTPQGTVAMTTDMYQPAIWGTADQKAKAVQQYLGRIDKAATRGHADQELMDLFKSTFTAMNAGYGAAGADLNAAQPVDLTSDANAFSDEDQSLLTGLADFNASITATRRATNPRRLKEVDSFEYTLNQSTQISGESRSNRAITQIQTAKLSAAYHQSLDSPSAKLKLSSDSATQNYEYNKVEDSSSTKVELAYEKDVAVRALIAQATSQSLQVLRVENNSITGNTLTPAQQQSKQTDLLPLLKALQRQQDAGPVADAEKQKKLQAWHAMVLG